MAWEWVAPTASASAGSIAVFFTWLAGHQGRRHAETVATQARTAAKDLAREDRRAAAYLDVLTVVRDMNSTTIRITSPIKLSGEPDPPPLPEQSEQALVEAKVMLYGSPAVKEIFKEWFGHAKKMVDNYTYIQIGTAKGLDTDLANIWKEQEKERKALNEAADRLTEQMNSELAS